MALGVLPAGSLKHTFLKNNFLATKHKKVLIVHSGFNLIPLNQKIKIDIILITGNPKVSLKMLFSEYNCTQYVFDGGIPLWKIHYWKKEADSLHLRHHFTAEQGAFITNL